MPSIALLLGLVAMPIAIAGALTCAGYKAYSVRYRPPQVYVERGVRLGNTGRQTRTTVPMEHPHQNIAMGTPSPGRQASGLSMYGTTFTRNHIDSHDEIKGIGGGFVRYDAPHQVKDLNINSVNRPDSKCYNAYSYAEPPPNWVNEVVQPLDGARIDIGHELVTKSPVHLAGTFGQSKSIGNPPDTLHKANGKTTYIRRHTEKSEYHTTDMSQPRLDVFTNCGKDSGKHYIHYDAIEAQKFSKNSKRSRGLTNPAIDQANHMKSVGDKLNEAKRQLDDTPVQLENDNIVGVSIQSELPSKSTCRSPEPYIKLVSGTRLDDTDNIGQQSTHHGSSAHTSQRKTSLSRSSQTSSKSSTSYCLSFAGATAPDQGESDTTSRLSDHPYVSVNSSDAGFGNSGRFSSRSHQHDKSTVFDNNEPNQQITRLSQAGNLEEVTRTNNTTP